MTYDTYSDLVNALEKGFLDINGKTNGNITGENAEKMASFYRYWSNYLDSTPAFLSFLAYIPGGIAKALYAITVSLEHVFNNMFKLFGLFGYLGDTNTVIGKFFQGFQLVGTTLFILILVTSAIAGVFTKPVKYKGVITNFLLVTMVTAVLPLALTTISSVVAQDAMNIQTVSSEAPEGSRYYSSLAIQPMKNNVVDLKVLIDNDFSTELFPLDNFGYIKPPKEGSTPVNNITDSTDKRDTTDFATRIDFGATYGASNSDLLKDMEAQYKKKFGVDGIEGLFLHRLNSNQTGVETITKHRIAGELNSFEPVYMRYKVNWIGMFMQYIILIVLLISMSIKLVKSVFDIIIQAMISPIQGYSSLSHSKKYKELLRTMGGALAGIFFEVVIMRVTLEICRDLPTLSVSTVTKLSGGFFDGLSMWEQCLAACLVYIGVFLAAMQGVSMIERWLGVSTGHSETAQQLIGAMMAGQAFATGAGAVGNMALGLGGFGMNMAGKVPGAVASGSKVLGNSLATTGGGIRGAFNAVKDQGIAGAAKGGLSNMFSAADLMGQEAIGKVKDFAGGVADHVEQKEQAGHDAAYRGLKDYSLPTEPRPVSPFDPDGGDGSTVSFGGDTAISDDTGPSGGGIIDPTIMPSEPSGEAFSGISDPTSLTKEPPMSSPIKDTLRHSENHSQVKRNFQQSMSDMHYMGQQMQQSAQRMQGQSHIRGAEIDESEE
ncbi:TPA: pLS20_p028 family conjugation system transmembrane protein [Streptococcus agalactiae]